MFPKLFTQSILFILIQWLVIKLVLASTGLTGLGYYFYYLSVLAPFFVLLSGHFKNYGTQDTELKGIGHIDWPALLTLRDQQFWSLMVVVCLGLLVVFFSNWTGSTNELDSNLQVISLFLLVCSLKFYEVHADTRQAHEIRNQTVGLGLKVTTVVFVIVFVVFVAVSLDLMPSFGLMLSLGGITLLTCAFLYLRLSIKPKEPASFPPDNKALTRTSTTSLAWYFIKTVGLQAFIVALIAAIPRITVEQLLGPKDLAVFGSLIYFYLLAHIIAMSLFQSRIAVTKNYHSLIRPLAMLMGIGVIAVGVSVSMHNWIITLVFDSNVAEHSWRLPYFVGFITIGVMVTYLEQFYILRHESDRLVRINLVVLILSFVLCPWFAFQWGFDGVVAYMYLLFVTKFVWLCAGVEMRSELRKNASQIEGKLNG